MLFKIIIASVLLVIISLVNAFIGVYFDINIIIVSITNGIIACLIGYKTLKSIRRNL